VIFFFDTSALVKRYLHEKGSARVRRLLQTADAIFYQTFVAPLEMTSAFYRRHRGGQISVEELSFLLRSYGVHSHNEYLLVPYSESLINLAEALISRHPLRALDAVQLASAVELRGALPVNAPPLIFVSADDRLVKTAGQEHLQAENPEIFP
jgi:predicted nucleic acid-binding protein